MYENSGAGTVVAIIIVVFVILVILAFLWYYGGSGSWGGSAYTLCGCAQSNQISHLVRCRQFRQLNPNLTYQQFCSRNGIAYQEGQNWPAY